MRVSESELKQWTVQLPGDDNLADGNQVVKLPPAIGSGHSYLTDLGEQFQLTLTDIELTRQTTFEGSNGNICGVFIVLQGQLQISIEKDSPVLVSGGEAGLFFIGDSHCHCHYSAGPTKIISFAVDLELMSALARQYQIQPDPTSGGWNDSLWTMPLNYELGSIIEQIYHCTLEGQSRQVYIRAKLMEILSLLFDWHHRQQDGAQDSTAPIQKAAQLIESRMANPPSLVELAHYVGVNDHKLKQEFKQIYDKTVFEYLHQKRMEKARQLLLQGQGNIKSVANHVGFKHPGHFSAKFREYYQQTPSEFIASRKVMLEK